MASRTRLGKHDVLDEVARASGGSVDRAEIVAASSGLEHRVERLRHPAAARGPALYACVVTANPAERGNRRAMSDRRGRPPCRRRARRRRSRSRVEGPTTSGSRRATRPARRFGPRKVVLRRTRSVWPSTSRRSGSRLVSSSSTMLRLQPRERGAEAEVDPVAEGEVAREFSRCRSMRSPSSKTFSSRLAEPSSMRRFAPSASSTSPTRRRRRRDVAST